MTRQLAVPSVSLRGWLTPAAGWALFFLLTAGGPAGAADVEELQQKAFEAVEERIECQSASPGERTEPCGRCDAAAWHPFDLHLPELVACEADHWLEQVSAPGALPPCARHALARRLRELSSPPPLQVLQSSYIPQVMAIEEPQRRADPADSTSLPFVRWVLFEGALDEVELGREPGAPEPAPDVCRLTSDSAVELAVETAVSVNRYAAKANQGVLARGVVGLARLRDDWAWFLEEGLGQFPWERALNALTDRRGGIADLPGRQWVLLHPSVAAEIDEGDFELDALRVQEALLIEPVGFVQYRFSGSVEEPERGFWGGSFLVSLREDADPGLGVLVRRNTFGLGAVWREVDTTDGGETDEFSVLLTLDLLGRVQKGQKKYQKYERALTDLLE